MNVAEKFNKTIRAIEEYSSSPMTAPEIAAAVASESGYPPRVLSDVFNYLSETPLISYIKMRKLTASYLSLASGNCDICTAVGIAAYSDQPSFTKAFKSLFGITPGDVLKKKSRIADIPQPLFWETLSGISASELLSAEGDVEEVETKIFGVAESTFQKLSRAIELESLYGFSSMFSNYAFELSERLDRPLEDCFQYVDSLREYGGDYSTGYSDEMTPEDRLREDGDNKDYQTVFFARGISVSFISELMSTFGATVDQLLRCDEMMLKQFPGFENTFSMSFSYYIQAYEYYSEHFPIVHRYDDWAQTEEGFFYDYITEIMAGVPIEIAFSEISDSIAIAEALEEEATTLEQYRNYDLQEEYEEMMRCSYIDKLAEEEERWSGVRIDDDLEYDPENVAFDEYDNEPEFDW